MTWVRIDDGFPGHPKVLKAGGDAAWLHVCALAYCNHYLTDGFIPTAMLSRLSDRKRPTALAARLVEVGLWEEAQTGWQIHDFLEYQSSKASVEAERLKARERMANARASSPNVRANNTTNKPRSSDSPSQPSPAQPIDEQVRDISTPVDTPSAGRDWSFSRMSAVADNYARIALQQANGINNRDAYQRTARKTALEHPDIGRYLERWPTAPPDAIAAWLHGDKHSMSYYHDTADDELAPVTDIRGET